MTDTFSPFTPKREPHPDVRDLIHFQILHGVLPIAALLSIVCAGVLVFIPGKLPMVVPMLCLAALFYFASRVWLPQFSSHRDVELCVAVLTISSIALSCIGTFAGQPLSPTPTALLILLSALLYIRDRNYVLFTLFALALDSGCQLKLTGTLTYPHIGLIIFGPIFAVAVRTSIRHLRKQIDLSHDALKTKVTELEAERSLRAESDTQLRHAQKMEGLGLLATGVAHDFNNYLYVISLMAEDLQLDQPKNEKVQIILSATEGASTICDRMLDYSGRLRPETQTLDIVDLIENIRPVLEVGTPHSVIVNFILPTTPLYADCEPAAIRQCVTNLVNNAYESIKSPSGTVQISAIRDPEIKLTDQRWRVLGDLRSNETDPFPGPALIIEVSDTGQGMTDEVLDRAFDPYFSTKTGRGHGFGLATTLGIVRSAGGVIRCKSDPKLGTTIQIVLPESNSLLVTPSDPDIIHAVPIVGKLLLVDDEEVVRRGARTLLEKVGYEVTVADSVQTAKRMIMEDLTAFQVVLADYSMPGATGLDLLAHLRKSNVAIPYILCSGFAWETIQQKEGYQPDAFLQKPFRLSQLQQTISEITRNGSSGT